MARRVDREVLNPINFEGCGPCIPRQSFSQFDGLQVFYGPTNPVEDPALLRADPTLSGYGLFAWSYRDPDSMNVGMSLGGPGAWNSVGLINREPRDRIRWGGPASDPVLYQGIVQTADRDTGWDIVKLIRVSDIFNPAGAWIRPPGMREFGGIALMIDQVWNWIFAVDPNAPDHLLAADWIDPDYKVSRNAGITWDPIPGLATLVSEGGRSGYVSHVGIFSHLTKFSFCPDDSNLILAGKYQNGVFFSRDGGATWEKVPGSEQATFITDFYWVSANEVYISTYGRGLWRMRVTLVVRPGDLSRFTRNPSIYRAFNGLQQNEHTFDHAFAVCGGHIMGAVGGQNGGIQSVYVTPGSSWIWASEDPKDTPPAVFYSDKFFGFIGMGKAPNAPFKDWIVKGLTVLNGTPAAVIFGPADVPLSDGPQKGKRRIPGDDPKPLTTPNLRILTDLAAGGPTFMPGEKFSIYCAQFSSPDLTVEIDGAPAKAAISKDNLGHIIAVVAAPIQFGPHFVKVSRIENNKVESASVAILVHMEDMSDQ